MTPQELLDRARLKLDDTIEPYLWSDDELLDYLNQSLTILLSETGLYSHYNSANVPANTSVIVPDNSDALLGISEVKFDNNPLVNVDLPEFFLMPSGKGTPRFYSFDYLTKTIHLHPTPSTDGVLSFKRKDTVFITWANLNTQLPFDQKYHLYLVDGMCAFAYLKADSEVYNPQQSERHMLIFRGSIEMIKKHTLLASQSFNMVATVPRGLL